MVVPRNCWSSLSPLRNDEHTARVNRLHRRSGYPNTSCRVGSGGAARTSFPVSALASNGSGTTAGLPASTSRRQKMRSRNHDANEAGIARPDRQSLCEGSFRCIQGDGGDQQGGLRSLGRVPHTSANSLPAIFAALAAAEGRRPAGYRVILVG